MDRWLSFDDGKALDRRNVVDRRPAMACLAAVCVIDARAPMAYIRSMIFIETAVFTRQITALVDDAGYADFQRELADDPEAGDLIPGTGGLRKIRLAAKGHGKRGGARVIYYYFTSAAQIALLLAYAKNEAENLTAAQKKMLKQVIEQWR